MRQSTSTQKSPRPSARRMTESSQLTGRPKSSRRTVRGASVSSTNTARAAGPPPTVLSDVFEIVADGNADVLADMIAFSGAQHMSELRSKKPEDYGRNLLHCAVANGQLGTLQVLLKHEGFDPNQVDSVYTRSTPMMEAVKIGGRLDLIECLLAAGGRLDVQDVNGDSALHWAAREISAAFLRQVLRLARKHGRTVPQLQAALQLKNNSGENAADVGANDVARESIRRLVSGEEPPGLPPKKANSTSVRSSQSGGMAGGLTQRNSHAAGAGAGEGAGAGGGGGVKGKEGGAESAGEGAAGGLRPSQSSPVKSTALRPSQSGTPARRSGQSGNLRGSRPSSPDSPTGSRSSQSGGLEGGQRVTETARKLPPEQALLFPKVKGVADSSSGEPEAPAITDTFPVRASSTPSPSLPAPAQSRGASG